jgi:hypothetical protein
MFKHAKFPMIAAALCFVPACAADSATETDGSVASAEQKLTYSTFTPVDGDSRGYTGDGDWSYGYWKGECALNQILVGVSRSYSSQPSPGRVHSLLCETVNGNMNPTQTLAVGSTDNRAENWTDWDPGYVKTECANAEEMSAISQDSGGVLKAIRCVSTASFRNACHTVQFKSTGGDNRTWSDGGDWDPTYQKNQCGDAEFVKGVSTYNTGKIKSILCCTYSGIIY